MSSIITKRSKAADPGEYSRLRIDAKKKVEKYLQYKKKENRTTKHSRSELDDALKMIVKMLTAQKEALRRTQKDSTKNFENKTDLEEGQESLS